MSSTDALREVCEVDDRVLKRIHLGVFGGHGDALGTHGHDRIAQSISIIGQRASELGHVGPTRRHLGVLNRIDAFGKSDHESVEVLCQFGNVLLGRSNGWFAFEHRAGVIGRCSAKLEWHGDNTPDRTVQRTDQKRMRRRRTTTTRVPILMAFSGILEQACRMVCPACQTEIPLAAGESVGFRDVCDRCRADLHVCLNCEHYDTTAYNECHESSSERILDKDRANRCEYFRPAQRAQEAAGGRDDALADLERLFKKD